MKILWTPRSIKSYLKIITYLSENWTEKEINKFVAETIETIELIEYNPYMYRATNARNNVRKGFDLDIKEIVVNSVDYDLT